MTTPPSWNATVPVGFVPPALGLVTVALKLADCPNTVEPVPVTVTLGVALLTVCVPAAEVALL
jgi:hypothetical protein